MSSGKRRTVKDDFTTEDCGQNALQLTARGSALIAEILRLAEFIPPEFRHPERFPDYKHIVTDFKYFAEQDAFEQVIQNSADLLQRDEEFRDTHMELLERFFKLFRGVHGYLVELNRYIEDIQEGLYISYSIESILAHPTGKQLLCEIYYLLGVMLLLLDQKISGKTREYLIVSYVRYKGAGEQQTVEVARLFRSTGRIGDKMPRRYPEEYFKRATGLLSKDVSKRIIGQLIGRIRSDDVYCLGDDMEILTRDGWKGWREAKRLFDNGALIVAGFDITTEKIVYEKPTAFIEKEGAPSDGMYEITPSRGGHDHVSLRVTGKHQLLRRRNAGEGYVKFTVADVIAGKKFEGSTRPLSNTTAIQLPCRAVNGVDAAVDILTDLPTLHDMIPALAAAPEVAAGADRDVKTKEELISLFMKLFGAFLADGSLNAPATGCNYTVRFAQKKPSDITFVMSTLEALGLKQGGAGTGGDFTVTKQQARGQVPIDIHRPSWVDFYFNEYAAKYKHGLQRAASANAARAAALAQFPNADLNTLCDDTPDSATWIPGWVWRRSRAQALAVLRGIAGADGISSTAIKKNHENSNCVHTSSTRFRDQCIILCAHAGYHAYFFRREAAGDKNAFGATLNDDSWTVRYSLTDPRFTKPDIKEVENYNEGSWCVSMPHQNIVVRRRHADSTKSWRPTIVGNCMLLNYPDPEHRSTALATQAAVLFVLLFFHTQLMDDRVIMREIVDKHFADNWIIAYYMGFTADIADYWRDFEGATRAIQATIAKDNIVHTKRVLTECVHQSNENLLELLRDGVLSDQFILDGIQSKLLPALRVANVALRWFILHNSCLDPTPKPEQARELKPEQLRRLCTTDDVLKLLLRLSQLEFILKDRFDKLLHEKKHMWNDAKEQSATKMNKLSQYFSGDHVLSDNVRMVQFEQWFADTAESIDGLSYSSSMGASQTIQKLMKAIDNITEFHQVSSNLQVVQFLAETKQLLRQMIRVTNIEIKVQIMISTIADLSYAWERFATERCFVQEIQDIIRRDPRLTIQMRSAFVKMASVIIVPCSRIFQAVANQPSLQDVVESVSKFYSSQLVTFVKEVLHVIPKTIFATLSEIANLVGELKECPNKINRKHMKEQSQLALRAKLAMLTSKVAQFACGILAMKSTLVGVIEVEPQQLLEEGIRAELRAQISGYLATLFQEKKGEKIVLSTGFFDKEMMHLAALLNGMRLSFEYVQDYVDVQGLRIWLEEFSRIVNFNVEMECNSYMHRKLYPWKSRFYAEGIPTEAYQQGVYPCSFLGRLMHAVLSMARASMYLPALGSWYDVTTRGEIVGDRTFECISLALGCQGLAALNRLMCFLTAKQTHEVITVIRKKVEANEGAFSRWRNSLLPTSAAVENTRDAEADQATLSEMEECITKKICHLTVDALEQIGRLQLVRDCILTRLRADAKLNSGMLFSSIGNANRGLIEDLEQHYASPMEHPMPGAIIPEVADFLEVSGVSDSHSKVYVTARALPEVPFIMAMLVVHNAARFVFDPQLNTLKPKEKNDRFAVDPVCFCHGVLTILRQFHSEQRKLFFNLLGRAIRGIFTLLTEAKDKAKTQAYDDLEALVRLSEILADRGGLPVSQLHDIIPSTLLCDPNVR